MKMKLNSLFFIFACVFCQNLYAEDIDLYVNYEVSDEEKLGKWGSKWNKTCPYPDKSYNKCYFWGKMHMRD